MKIRAFVEGQPYAHVVDADPYTDQDVHKVRLTAQVPGNIKPIVKDAASNLRDALDHAVYACAIVLNKGNPRYTGFPFAKNALGVMGELGSKRLRDNPPEIRPILAEFEPHATGNLLLWGLNQIRNPNTHRVLVPMGIVAISPSTFIRQGVFRGNYSLGYSRWDPAKKEVEFARVPRDSLFQYDVQVSFFIVFGDVGALKGKEVIGTMNQIGAEVERVVSLIETETRRIAIRH